MTTTAIAPSNVLIVGAGMYVCGIGTEGFGTILPAVFEGYRKGLVGRITIVATNPAKRDRVQEKVRLLNGLMGLDARVECFPRGGEVDPGAYRELAATGDYAAAIVAIPDHLHFEVTRELIGNRLHCLVVKPLVARLHEVEELIRLQREMRVFCAVEFHKRFDETNLRIRRMIRDGMIGDVLYALVEFSQRRSIPLETFRAWSAQSNIFQYLGVHYVDLIYFCSGALPARAMAVGQKCLLEGAGVDTFDSIQSLTEWTHPDTTTSFTSAILTNWIDPHITTAMSDQKIKYIGTQGRIECDQKERGLKLVSDEHGIQDINPYFSDFRYNIDDSAFDFRGYGYKSVMQFLVDCHNLGIGTHQVADLGGLRATFREAKVSTAVLEAVNQSLASNGAWIDIETDSLLS